MVVSTTILALLISGLGWLLTKKYGWRAYAALCALVQLLGLGIMGFSSSLMVFFGIGLSIASLAATTIGIVLWCCRRNQADR